VSRTCVPRICCWQYSCMYAAVEDREVGTVWNTEKWSPWEIYFLFSSAASLGCGDGRKITNSSLSWYSPRFVRSFQNFLVYSYIFRNSVREWILVLVFVVFIELDRFISLYWMVSCLKRTTGIDSRSPRSLWSLHYISLNLRGINFRCVALHL
jgi:hypothetical protein